MTAYIVSGLVTGSVIAILGLGLGLTQVAARIFNVGHGATAFFVAMCFYELRTSAHWPTWAAGVVSILVIAPALGLVLWAALFRSLADRSATVKLVATIGLYVALPAATLFAFGNNTILSAPGLAGASPGVHSILGTRLNSNQILALLAALIVALALSALLRLTRFGLMVRSVVDAPTISELSGINSTRVSLTVWALSSAMAGLSGVLLAPLVGLNTTEFGLLLVSSFAAVVVARFRSLIVIFVASLLIGVVQDLSVKYLPESGFFASATFRASIPFLVIFVVLIYFQLRGTEWGLLDRVAFSAASSQTLRRLSGAAALRRYLRSGAGLVLAAAVGVALVLGLFSSYWVSLFAGAVALGVVLLSYVLVAGEGAMISLCQISIAGAGAAAMGQLTSVDHWPFLVALLSAALVGALVSVPVGLIVTRLGNLYFALATLAFGLLMDNMVFADDRFYQFGSGVAVAIPHFLQSPTNLFITYAGVFVVLALALKTAQRATIGMALAAVRSSPAGVETLGLNVPRTRLATFVVGGFVAGLGGALFCVYTQLSLPASQFQTLTGLVWLAVLVTFGVRSPLAALLAGISLELMPQLITEHLSTRWNELLPAFFGLGAIGLARDPRGVVQQNADHLRALARRLRGSRRRTEPVIS